MLIPGEKTRNYVRGTDTLVTDHDGVARISFADFGVAMVDLVDAGFDAVTRNPQRLTVGYRSQVAAA